MKNLILLLLTIITIPLYSQTIINHAITREVDYCDGYGYRLSVKCIVTTTLDFTNNVISIATDPETIYYVQYTERYKTTNYKVVKCQCFDTDGIKCIVELFLYPNNIYYIKISYSNVVIKYKCVYK